MIEHLHMFKYPWTDLERHLLPGHGSVAAQRDKHLDAIVPHTRRNKLFNNNRQ
jgi:hypothetical protein